MVFRNYAWAHEWVKQGHDVTIIASRFSHSRHKNPSGTNRIIEENINGVRYLWLWGNAYHASSTLGRLFSMAFYMAQTLLLPLPLTGKYDLVIASSPHPFVIYPARRLAKKNKAKLVYDIRDLWPLTLLKLGKYGTRNPVIRLMQAAENYACRHADLVTAVPRHCEDYLRIHGLAPGKFLHIANGAVLEESATPPLPEANAALLRSLHESGCFIVGYAGTLGIANAMHTLIDALAGTDSKIHVVILGHGPCLEDLRQRARENEVAGRVHFLAPVARAQVADFLDKIDIAYLGLQNSPLYGFGASLTKINDYMLAGKPILYAGNDPQNAVEESGGGIICDAENTEQVRKTLNTVVTMPKEELTHMGQRGREWLMKNQLVSEQVRRILEFLGLQSHR